MFKFLSISFYTTTHRCELRKRLKFKNQIHQKASNYFQIYSLFPKKPLHATKATKRNPHQIVLLVWTSNPTKTFLKKKKKRLCVATENQQRQRDSINVTFLV